LEKKEKEEKEEGEEESMSLHYYPHRCHQQMV
jgi:hypothetical protein